MEKKTLEMGVEKCRKGHWSRDEDRKMVSYILQYGPENWRNLPAEAGLERSWKSCRTRWVNYLRPDSQRGKFSPYEESSILRLHALLGNSWSAIATHLPNRTDNEIKNYWHVRLKKRLIRKGVDPATHKPMNHPTIGSAHSAQWETTRLEAEARLARQSSNYQKATAASSPPPQLVAPPGLDVLNVCQETSITSRFFSEPPTCTLNFSSDSPAVPTVRSGAANDVVVCMDDVAEWKNEEDGYNMIGEIEEDGSNWNELLNLVRSSVKLSYVVVVI